MKELYDIGMPSRDDGFPYTVSKEELYHIIQRSTELIQSSYVFPEVADQIGTMLSESLGNGRYTTLTDPDLLAEQLLKDVQSFNSDKHLRVFFDRQQAQALQVEEEQGKPTPSVAELQRSNFGFHKVEILQGNVGFLDIRLFAPLELGEKTASLAFRTLSDVDALIIDLRNSRGGSPSMVQFITSYLFDSEPVKLCTIYRKFEDQFFHRYTLPSVPGKRLSNIDVYVLMSNETWSAAEEFCYNLRCLDRALLIGKSTKGGAHPCRRFVLSNRFVISIPIARAFHPKTNSNWEGTGVQPHIEMECENLLDRVHQMALKKLSER